MNVTALFELMFEGSKPENSQMPPVFASKEHPAKGSRIDAVLQDYEAYGGVSFHWRLIGSSGHDKRPKGPITAAYTSCVELNWKTHRQVRGA